MRSSGIFVFSEITFQYINFVVTYRCECAIMGGRGNSTPIIYCKLTVKFEF